MEHLAILSKKLDILSKIISGEKTIESRWYKFKKSPYKSITPDEVIYFKESGSPVTAKAKAEKALFFDSLTPEKIQKILSEYQKQICVDMSYFEEIKSKKFCSLIFLKDVEKIAPFKINKDKYGIMSAWISVNSIDDLKFSE